MILLCSRVRELYIINISVESRALPSCYDLEKKEGERENKKKQRDHIDLMESNELTYKEYDE
jgi:hypothetical protein